MEYSGKIIKIEEVSDGRVIFVKYIPYDQKEEKFLKENPRNRIIIINYGTLKIDGENYVLEQKFSPPIETRKVRVQHYDGCEGPYYVNYDVPKNMDLEFRIDLDTGGRHPTFVKKRLIKESFNPREFIADRAESSGCSRYQQAFSDDELDGLCQYMDSDDIERWYNDNF